jgi:hypothetical protein
MMNALLPRELKNVLCRQNFRNHLQLRTLVSSEFMNQDAWQTRLAAPVFKNIKMQEYFTTLDKKFTHEFRGSAVDVDIFANNVQNSIQAEHMEELLFKLRRTPHTLHTLESTHHAAVRAMLDYGETENLVKMLDDRKYIVACRTDTHSPNFYYIFKTFLIKSLFGSCTSI